MAYRLCEDFKGQPAIKLIGDEAAQRKVKYESSELPSDFAANSPVPMAEGCRVDARTVPKSVLWDSKRVRIKDYITRGHTALVTERFKDVIEQAEPNTHQFIPVDIYRPGAKQPSEHRYWMVICRSIDSADLEHTTLERLPEGVWAFRDYNKFFISKKAIGSAKLWRDPYVAAASWVSNDLQAILQASRLTGFFFKQCSEI